MLTSTSIQGREETSIVNSDSEEIPVTREESTDNPSSYCDKTLEDLASKEERPLDRTPAAVVSGDMPLLAKAKTETDEVWEFNPRTRAESRNEAWIFAKSAIKIIDVLSDASTPFYTWEITDTAGEAHPTNAGAGRVDVSGRGLLVETLDQRIMDFGNYVGNVKYVKECRSEPDLATAPDEFPFFQRIGVAGQAFHYTLNMVTVDNYEYEGRTYSIRYWHLLDQETFDLGSDAANRTAENMGGWVIRHALDNPETEDVDESIYADEVGYFLHSIPYEEDVGGWWGLMNFAADKGAKSTILSSIESVKYFV